MTVAAAEAVEVALTTVEITAEEDIVVVAGQAVLAAPQVVTPVDSAAAEVILGVAVQAATTKL